MNAPTQLWTLALREELHVLSDTNPERTVDELALAFVEHHEEHEFHDVRHKLYALRHDPVEIPLRHTVFGPARAAWSFVDVDIEHELHGDEPEPEPAPVEEEAAVNDGNGAEPDADSEEDSISTFWEFEFLPMFFVMLECAEPGHYFVSLNFAGDAAEFYGEEIDAKTLAAAKTKALRVAVAWLAEGARTLDWATGGRRGGATDA